MEHLLQAVNCSVCSVFITTYASAKPVIIIVLPGYWHLYYDT